MLSSHLWTRVRRRLQQRDHYAGLGDWVRALYSRVLMGRAGAVLPGRGHLTSIRLADLDHPFHIRLGATDSRVVEQIFMDDEYAAVTSQDIGPVRQIVDLGSNVGISIRWWKRHYPNAVIVGVEPDAMNLAVCRQNTASIPGVYLLHACAAATPRTVYLDAGTGAWGITMTDRANGQQPVRAATIPEIIAEAGMSGPIDLLKMDIEGAEEEIFANCRDWIQDVRTLVVELHTPYRRAAFLEHLRAAGARFDHTVLQDGPMVEVLMLRNAGQAK